ncbi:HlyD family secretion protein [Shewanella zhangzhouensis]|uniref:HlyD family secretion protein n=1 Tax=Shewanella zhangzhouensis TaxID=2864213 RepID=UPI001C65EDB7|nr:HlyD family secretion protein [Shewanella zhangzhouensis]QYK06270.1 HlyD family secretion protein [Shewanella zhangzhouensis]
MPDSVNASKKISTYLFLTVLGIWLYSLWADRVTPMTTQAFVHAYLVRITPEVAGNIVQVNVGNDKRVEAGELLFEIDASQYQIAREKAQADLERVGQSLGASTAAVQVAQAKVGDARAALDNAKAQAARVETLAERGVLSQAELDNAREAEQRAQASLAAAEASLLQAKQNLGPVGENNPELKAAMAALAKAELDLKRTRVVAPSRGVVTNVQLSPGQYMAPGQPALTFIDPREVWISAMMRENSLEHIRKGVKVGLVFDALPGRVFEGVVDSIGWGSGGANNIDQTTGFETAQTGKQQAKRFPVHIRFDTAPMANELRFGSQVTVAFYTGESSVGEVLAQLWLWCWSKLTYVS